MELARSNKKVKDIHHADFRFSNGEGASSQEKTRNNGLSLKEKLLGEIPGAYNQAF